MVAESYRIVFKGEILPEKDLDVVKVSMAQIFSMDIQKVQSLFSGKAVSVKRGLDEERARKFRKAFERAGARAYIVSENGTAPPPKPNFEVESTLRRGAPVPMTCPDCGEEQPLTQECIKCGWTSPGWR